VTIGLGKEGIFQAVMERTGLLRKAGRVWESPGELNSNKGLCKKKYAPANAPLENLSLVEFAAGSGLVGPDAAGDDLRLKIIFAFDRTAGEPAKHGNLPDVSEGVRDGTLKKFFDGSFQAFGGGKQVVELLEHGEEAAGFGIPWKRLGIAPSDFSMGHRERPIEKIAEVGEDFRRRAGGVA